MTSSFINKSLLYLILIISHRLFCVENHYRHASLISEICCPLRSLYGGPSLSLSYVSQLKLAVGTQEVQLELLREFQGPVEKLYPTEILDRRELFVQGAHIPQLLIKWNEGERDTTTWEDVTTIKEQ